MRKIISSLLAVALALPMSTAINAGAASSAWQSDSEVTALLSGLDIMKGDGNGNFNLDEYVTRAEMAKLAVASSSYKNSVAVGLQFSPFSDVSGTFWGAPYIQAAVSAGIVNGYIDGTFKPSGNVKYEEAVTMMLKVLGYTDDDFGASYPYGQVGTADSLKMTEGMNASIGSPLTRRQAAILICNSLDTKGKTTGQDLIGVHDCAIIEDVTIIAGQGEDSTLAADEISTTSGKYRTRNNFDDAYVGCRGDMVVKDGKYFVAFSSDGSMSSEKYVIYSTLNDEILCYREGDNNTIRQFKISGSTTCYKASTAYSYDALKSQMAMGDTIRVRYKSNGEIDYINYNEGDIDGPIKVSGSWQNSFAINEKTKYVRDGSQVSVSDIKTNDIIYYSADLNMVLAYTNKITGIYESASPSKDSPQSVTISGKTYELEGVDAFNDFSANGSLNYGDTVTALLGRDGKKIAGVAGGSGSYSAVQAGFVTSTGKKSFDNADGTTYSSYYVDLISTDGVTYTYPVTSNPENFAGKVVKASIKDGKAQLSYASDTGLSGKISYDNMTIGSKKVADNVSILDVSVSSTTDGAAACRVFMQRLDGLELLSSNVGYYATNGSGEISELILKNVTGDMYDYGIVTKGVSKSSGSDSITLDIDGASYTSNGYQSCTGGTPIRCILEQNTIKNLITLSQWSNVSEVTFTEAVAGGGATFKLSDKVKVYKKIDIGNYALSSINEAVNGDYTYQCYYDKDESKGGRIRVIVIQKK